MGMIIVEGFDKLSISLDKLAALPDSVVSEMLVAGGEVIKDAHQAKLEGMGISDTGQLAASIKLGRPNARAGTIEIRPSGTRKRGNTTTRNEAIGYINEYGKKGVAARPWMREANAEAEDKAADAAAKPFENFLDKIGL